jgi:ribonuclease T1
VLFGRNRPFGAFLWALLLATGVSLAPVTAGYAKGPLSDTQEVVSVAALPQKAQTVYALILQGGPFEFDKDGTVFGNRERLLPLQRRGYYREYTVKTSAERNRGSKRIVCGGHQPRQPVACYYTDDHYNSFRRVLP